jgi:hypothetical protein
MANFISLDAGSVPGKRLVDAQDLSNISNLLNIPAAKYVKNTTAGATVAAAGDLTGAGDTFVEYSAVGAANLTTRTAAQMFADTPNSLVGYMYALSIVNTSGGTTTLVGGTGVTITGTATLLTNTVRQFMVTFVSSTAITMQSVGVSTIS